MTYKSLSLAALLLPCFGYGITKEARINQLKETQFKTTFELKSIMEQIRSIAYGYYTSNEASTFLKAAIDVKAELPENKNISQDVLEKIVSDQAESLQSMLEKALFCMPGVDDSKIEKRFLSADANFTPLDALYIEGAVEKACLALLQEKAQKCLQELLVINKELAQLSKLYIQ